MNKKRILTGDRPTGKLHLGHYVGTLKNRIKLQDEYETFVIIADLHTLTTKPEKEHIQKIKENVKGKIERSSNSFLKTIKDPELQFLNADFLKIESTIFIPFADNGNISQGFCLP